MSLVGIVCSVICIICSICIIASYIYLFSTLNKKERKTNENKTKTEK